ncbi:MAG: hypothetical protein IJ911_04270 [Salinivirgaceae bacterium]|nr:hypothetical protein [Salinivirgaceae bacterium]
MARKRKVRRRAKRRRRNEKNRRRNKIGRREKAQEKAGNEKKKEREGKKETTRKRNAYGTAKGERLSDKNNSKRKYYGTKFFRKRRCIVRRLVQQLFG